MSKIKIGFSGLNVPAQLDRARIIDTAMTGNPNFVTPVPSLPTLETKIDALQLAWDESRNRDKVKIEIMKMRRSELLATVTQLSAYVQSTSNGDKEIILSSGFGVIERGVPQPPVGQVLNVRISNGTIPGSLKLLWDKVPNARVYVLEISTDPFTEDTFKPKGVSTKIRMQIEGLVSGTKYWIRIAAISSNGIGLWSYPAWDIAK